MTSVASEPRSPGEAPSGLEDRATAAEQALAAMRAAHRYSLV